MAASEMCALVITTLDDLRDQLRGLTSVKLAATAARFRLDNQPDSVLAATKHALRELGRRWQLRPLHGRGAPGRLDGQQLRHRLNRGGDRDANCALHQVAITRLRYDERTQKYMNKRITEGKTKREVLRCLKRYISREVFNILRHTPVLTRA